MGDQETLAKVAAYSKLGQAVAPLLFPQTQEMKFGPGPTQTRAGTIAQALPGLFGGIGETAGALEQFRQAKAQPTIKDYMQAVSQARGQQMQKQMGMPRAISPRIIAGEKAPIQETRIPKIPMLEPPPSISGMPLSKESMTFVEPFMPEPPPWKEENVDIEGVKYRKLIDPSTGKPSYMEIPSSKPTESKLDEKLTEYGLDPSSYPTEQEKGKALREEMRREKVQDKKAEAMVKRGEAEKDLGIVVEGWVRDKAIVPGQTSVTGKDRVLSQKELRKSWPNVDYAKLIANGKKMTSATLIQNSVFMDGILPRLDMLEEKLKKTDPTQFPTLNALKLWIGRQIGAPESPELTTAINDILFEVARALGSGAAMSDLRVKIEAGNLDSSLNPEQFHAVVRNLKQSVLSLKNAINKPMVDPRHNPNKDFKGRRMRSGYNVYGEPIEKGFNVMGDPVAEGMNPPVEQSKSPPISQNKDYSKMTNEELLALP